MPATAHAIEAFPQRPACTHCLDAHVDPLHVHLPVADFIPGAGLSRGYMMAELKPEPFGSRLILPLAAECRCSSRPLAAQAS